jgi:hypothetical protein
VNHTLPLKSREVKNAVGFVTTSQFAAFYPIDSKRIFCCEYGVSERLVYDGAKEQTGKKTELSPANQSLIFTTKALLRV